MPRYFYTLAVFLHAILAFLVIVQSLLFSMVGKPIHYLGALSNWLLGAAFFSALQAIVMLKYLVTQRHTIAFRTGFPAYLLTVVTLLIHYTMLDLGYGSQLYVPASILTHFLSVVYGATLFITIPRDNKWLRIAGLYTAIFSLLIFCLTVAVVSGQFIKFHPLIENFNTPISWLSIVPPLLLLMVFYRELKAEPDEHRESPVIYTIAYPVIIMAALYLTVQFAGEALGMRKWLPDMEAAIKKVAEPFEARTYVSSDGDSLKYRLLRPPDFDPSKRYPIFVCLHGSSGEGNDNYRQVAAALFPEFITHGTNREKYPAFVFVPQCPFGTSWGGVHPLPGIDKIVFEAITALEREFPIDPARRYVGGASLGGYGTWHFIESHPNTFAAAIPICGAGDPDLASNCANIPVWAFHGAKDSRVPVSGSRDMIDAIKKAGGNPKYTEYPDEGHHIGKLVCDTPGLLDWLFAQRRDSTRIR